eukprot:7388064-Prymnesium_polylepis.1
MRAARSRDGWEEGSALYLAVWTGFARSKATWEPAAHIYPASCAEEYIARDLLELTAEECHHRAEAEGLTLMRPEDTKNVLAEWKSAGISLPPPRFMRKYHATLSEFVGVRRISAAQRIWQAVVRSHGNILTLGDFPIPEAAALCFARF